MKVFRIVGNVDADLLKVSDTDLSMLREIFELSYSVQQFT
jgi:hypothetical protein